MTRVRLPIDAVLDRVCEELARDGAVVISAPPGSGKTTRVPAALVDRGFGDVIVLEPRRIAARAAARRVAYERGGNVGEEVGYEVRDERRVGRATRLRFLTEGILVRRLVSDPVMQTVGTVVLDEFHERHLECDLAISMLAEIRETVRPDLRLVVMSATLDVEPLRAFLQPCAHVTATGTLHDVRVEHVVARRGTDPVRAGVVRALDETPGDVLVFLPGMAEIRRAERELEDLAVRRDLALLPLHGTLDVAAQDRALEPLAKRKVVLSTNVAESSLTIEGVTAVVDTGLVRVLRHDPGRGLDVLRVERISRASARQRAGRAGRLGPGVCYRLWHQADERGLAEFDVPEVRRLDLAGPSLLVRAFAGRDPAAFGWFEPPDPVALARADELLRRLALVDAEGRLTDDGRRALALPLHPRLGRVMCEARRRGCARAAAELVARIEERPGAARAIVRTRDRILRVAGVGRGDDRAPDRVGQAILAGYPDRVVARRGAEHGQLVGGRGVVLRDPSLRDADLLVAPVVEDRDAATRSLVRLAVPVERQWLDEVLPGSVTRERLAEFDRGGTQVVAVTRTRFLDLVLDEHRGGPIDHEAVERLLADVIRREPWKHLGSQRSLRGFLARVAWLREVEPGLGLPDLDEAAIGEAAAQLAAGKRSLREFQEAPVRSVLDGLLTREQRARLRADAPEKIVLANGRALRVDYGSGPRLSARLQDFFGLRETPRLAGGRVPVTLELLAPNHRAVQITDDLASFWDNVYPGVRSELRRRYPKHAWPEDPRVATPDRKGRSKPR